MRSFVPQNIIGAKVKYTRIQKRLTQQQLSEKLELMGVYINRSSLSKIENNTRNVYDFELLALSRALSVSVDWLLDGC